MPGSGTGKACRKPSAAGRSARPSSSVQASRAVWAKSASDQASCRRPPANTLSCAATVTVSPGASHARVARLARMRPASSCWYCTCPSGGAPGRAWASPTSQRSWPPAPSTQLKRPLAALSTPRFRLAVAVARASPAPPKAPSQSMRSASQPAAAPPSTWRSPRKLALACAPGMNEAPLIDTCSA